jgi:hypothetical protein
VLHGHDVLRDGVELVVQVRLHLRQRPLDLSLSDGERVDFAVDLLELVGDFLLPLVLGAPADAAEDGADVAGELVVVPVHTAGVVKKARQRLGGDLASFHAGRLEDRSRGVFFVFSHDGQSRCEYEQSYRGKNVFAHGSLSL